MRASPQTLAGTPAGAPAGGRALPEDRDKHPLCGAKKRRGGTCRMYAGQGTNHVGIGKCRLHGGSTPNHEKSALALEFKRRMVSLAEPLSEDASPQRVLGNLMRMAAGNVQWLDGEIRRLEDLGTADAAAKLALYTQEREITARVAKMCSEANVEQVEATIKQAQAELLAKQVLDAAKLIGLTDDQVRALGRALRLLVADGDPGADADLQRLLEQIQADDERRIERLAKKEAQRLSGLTLPPQEWVTAPADLG